jgi:hypothetical protein
MTHTDGPDEPDFDVPGYLDKAHNDAYRGDGWEMPALIALVVIVAFMFFGGIRGVILAIVWIVAVALLLYVRRGLTTFVVLVAAVVLTLIGIIALFQTV